MAQHHWPREAGRKYQTDGSPDAGAVAPMADESGEQSRGAIEIPHSEADSTSCTGRRRSAAAARRVPRWVAPVDVDLVVRAADCLCQPGQPDAGARDDAEAADLCSISAGRAAR